MSSHCQVRRILEKANQIKSNGKILQKNLPDRVSNPGLPRDRREYLPLYYRGLVVEFFQMELGRTF